MQYNDGSHPEGYDAEVTCPTHTVKELYYVCFALILLLVRMVR